MVDPAIDWSRWYEVGPDGSRIIRRSTLAAFEKAYPERVHTDPSGHTTIIDLERPYKVAKRVPGFEAYWLDSVTE